MDSRVKCSAVLRFVFVEGVGAKCEGLSVECGDARPGRRTELSQIGVGLRLRLRLRRRLRLRLSVEVALPSVSDFGF